MSAQPDYLMALDVGERRIGVAIAQRVARLPRPLKTLERSERIIEDIKELVSVENVGALVVGLPRGMSGQYTEQTKKTEAFADELKQALPVPVYLSDETLTSVQAESVVGTSDKAAIDAQAAAYILEDFLHDHPEVLA